MAFSGLASFGSCLLIGAGFVASLYLIPAKISALPRNNPTHVKWRIAVTTAYSSMLPFALSLMLDISIWDIFTTMGFVTDSFFHKTFAPLTLFLILFTGPLYNMALSYVNDATYFSWDDLDLVFIRNVLVAPLIEEVVFRACMIVLFKSSSFDFKDWMIILLGPIPFGISHLHHFIEHVRSGKDSKNALQIVLFQLLYTSFFGGLVFAVFLRTEQIFSITAIHMFCNFMQVPDLSFNNSYHENYKQRNSIKFAYLLGIVGFLLGFRRLTEV